jgi:hypothetical protein
MSISDRVNHDVRFFHDIWEAEEYDTASVKIPHEYNPRDNYVVVEFKMPSIKRQIPQRSFDAIVDQMFNIGMHQLNYKKVDNSEFHTMLKKEGWGNITKIRRRFGDDVYTFYISEKRKMRGFVEDYYMAIMVFLGYPQRDYMRRAPCYNIDPKCIKCYDFLASPVLDWLDDPEPYKTTLYKYFFTLPGELQRLCIAYSREIARTPGTCFLPEEPDYYIVDESMKYFNGGTDNIEKWKNMVLSERRLEDRIMYHLEVGPPDRVDYGDGPSLPPDGEEGTVRKQSFRGYGSPVMLTRYNYRTSDTVPDVLLDAISRNDFDALWYADMRSFNARNSISKYLFNHWQDVCMVADDGWVCGWNMDQTIGVASDLSGYSEEQAIQLATAYGYETSSGSTDRIYTLQQDKIQGYEYEEYVEKYIKPA